MGHTFWYQDKIAQADVVIGKTCHVFQSENLLTTFNFIFPQNELLLFISHILYLGYQVLIFQNLHMYVYFISIYL